MTIDSRQLNFKLKHNISVGENSLIKLTSVHSHNTRLAQNSNYFINHRRTNLGQHSFSYNGPKIWITVPENIKLLRFPQFKFKLKQFLMEKYE